MCPDLIPGKGRFFALYEKKGFSQDAPAKRRATDTQKTVNKEIAGANATAPETVAQDTATPDTLSEQDMVARFMTEGEKPEGDAPVVIDETEEVAEIEEEETPPEVEEAETDQSGDQIDEILSGLSNDQQRELATKLGGRLGGDIGELRGEVRRLESLLTVEREKAEPFERKPVGDNPYKSSSREELEETYNLALQAIREGTKVLRKNRDSEDDEVIHSLNDQELTRGQVEEWIANAEDARDTFIPDRLKDLNQAKQYESQRESFLVETKKIHPWMDEEDNDKRKHFDGLSSGLGDRVRAAVPEVAPFLDIILADYTTAYWDRQNGTAPAAANGKPKAAKPIATTRKRAPGTPGGSAAASSRPTPKSAERDQFLKKVSAQGRMSEAELVQFLAT